MKKQRNKPNRQREKQQTPKPTKNEARYRSRNDGVYREGHRDDLVRYQIRARQSEDWRAVLAGSEPAIVLPIGQVNSEELERCRHAVIEMHGKPAQEEPYYEEFDQFLTPKQLEALGNSMPVIMMTYVERQFDVTLRREHSSLQNRVRDSIEFGLGQGLQRIGRLWFARHEAETVASTAAAEFAAGRFAQSWKPAHESRSVDDWCEYVLTSARAGNLWERADHFIDPTKSDDFIKAEIRAIRGPAATVDIERQFWQTIVIGLINCKGHDGKQASAQRQISRSFQTGKPVARADVLGFMGVDRVPIQLINVMALAYFDMPDADRLFPTFRFHYPDFEALSVLGALTRGQSVRIDAKTARRLSKSLSNPKPFGVKSSEDNPPQVLTPDEFLRHAMARVGSDKWWSHVLQSSPDNFGVRHVHKGENLGAIEPGVALDDRACQKLITKLLGELMSAFAFKYGEIDECRIWQYVPLGNVMLIDMERMMKNFHHDVGLILLHLVDALAAGLHQGLGLDDVNAINPQWPGYYREMVRIAAASHAVMRVIAPRLCNRRQLDLHYYARYLTDLEYQTAHAHGETTARRILDVLRY